MVACIDIDKDADVDVDTDSDIDVDPSSAILSHLGRCWRLRAAGVQQIWKEQEKATQGAT